MPNIKYHYISLGDATIIQRRHPREIEPPGMVNIENAITSRSDSSITMRPPWVRVYDDVYGFSSVLNTDDTAELRDAVNSATGLYGSGQVLFLTSYIPYGINSGSPAVLSDTHGNGSCSLIEGENTVVGTNTDFYKRVYRGAIVRFEGLNTSYTGAPYLWLISTNTDEWYMTDQDENEVPLQGSYIRAITGASLYMRYGEPGSMAYYGQIGEGDEDALGFDALYTRLSGDPAQRAGDSSKLFNLQMGTNISGAKYMWTDSPTTPNEYYMTARDTTEPDLVPDSWSGSSSTPSYIRVVNSDNRSYAHPFNTPLDQIGAPTGFNSGDVIDYGEVESLADEEWGIGDADSLGFNTVYYRLDAGDPDALLASVGSSRWDGVTGEVLSWPQSMVLSGYKDVSTSATYTWQQSAKSRNTGFYLPGTDTPVTAYLYYLKISSGDPGIPHPEDIYMNGSKPRRRSVELLKPGLWDDQEWGYGNHTLDNLGYDTIYAATSWDGTMASVDVEIIMPFSYQFSDYGWAASATSDEYYMVQQDGSTEITADFNEPHNVSRGVDGKMIQGTVGSLSDGEWGFGKLAGDSLTYDTIYVGLDAGNPDDIGMQMVAEYDFQIYSSKYKWTESGTSDMWYITLSDGSDPSISLPTNLSLDGYEYTYVTMQILSPNEWTYGNEDSLGFNTIYVYAESSPDGAIGTGENDETKPVKIVIKDASSDFDYYMVDKVNGNDDLLISGLAVSSISDSKPVFYYNHNPYRSKYKFNIQSYTQGLIYNTPSNEGDVNREDISGPFYAGLQKGDWKYQSKVLIDKEFEGTGVTFNVQPLLAGSGSSYLQAFQWIQDEADDSFYIARNFLALSYGLSGPWEKAYINTHGDQEGTLIEIDGDYQSKVVFNGMKAYGSTYIAPVIDCNLDSPATSSLPGYAHSTDAFGLEWDMHTDSAYEWSTAGRAKVPADWEPIAVAWNGDSPGRIVLLYWQSTTNRVTVRYTDDDGTTFNDAAVGGAPNYFVGDETSRVDYFGGQFIITRSSGLYYGDGTTFTEKSLTGSDYTSVAYSPTQGYAALDRAAKKVNTALDVSGTWTLTDLPVPEYAGAVEWLMWDTYGERWVVNLTGGMMWTSTLDVDDLTGYPPWLSEPILDSGEGASQKEPTNMVSDAGGLLWCTYDGGAYYFRHIRSTRYSYYWWDVEKFVPLSKDFRAQTFSVLDGYVVLIGTSERTWDNIDYDKTESLSPNPSFDDEEKDFTFAAMTSLGDHGIKPETVVATATLTDGTIEEITDDGAGVLKGTVSATGTISYETGIMVVIFNDITAATGSTFSVRYTYLIEGDTTGWEYHPRRIRWTAPKTYDDFEGVGSGTGDASGDGAFLDSRPVNGRIVVFETSAITSIVPRGDVFDPWDFDTIRSGVKLLSNPVVVDDKCYFIATDGLLWETNGIDAKESGSSYDATLYDDFNEEGPVFLDYSVELNSLLVYHFDLAADVPAVYTISLAVGTVTKSSLPFIPDDGVLAKRAASVFAVSNSDDETIYGSHHPTDSNDDKVVLYSLSTGFGVTGEDIPMSGVESYYHSTIETGELYLNPEGKKTSLKNVTVRTFVSDDEGAGLPVIALEVKSNEDADWTSEGDTAGTTTISTTTCTGASTAWSNLIAGPNSGDTQQKCNGVTVLFTLPCLAKQARIYLDSTLLVEGTDYANGATNSISFGGAYTPPAADETLYAYWDVMPEIRVAVGDVYKSSEGFHRIESIESAQDITLDHYMSTGSDAAPVHYPTTEMPVGNAETKLGLNKLVEGVSIRLYVIPKYNTDPTPEIVKVTGISIGHIPQGSKILQATGS